MTRRTFNLELDLRTQPLVVKKVQSERIYAQNLYSALCNNEFAPKDTWALLKNLRWSCTWYDAATIVAELREEDRSQWYRSGPRFREYADPIGYVDEGVITEEIHSDLDSLGWLVLTCRYIQLT
jgi:hypothetical protein